MEKILEDLLKKFIKELLEITLEKFLKIYLEEFLKKFKKNFKRNLQKKNRLEMLEKLLRNAKKNHIAIAFGMKILGQKLLEISLMIFAGDVCEVLMEKFFRLFSIKLLTSFKSHAFANIGVIIEKFLVKCMKYF